VRVNAAVRRRVWRGCTTALLVALATASPGHAADLKFIETEDLRIIYFDPTEKYLVPHVTQSFLTGLAAHKRLLDYVPDGDVNLLLEDFTDRSNATTLATPNRIFLDIAPSYEPFETVSSAEWFAWTAAHELTHLADNDRASPADARFRRLFHGKVDVDSAHPETLLYNYLTTPRLTAPRWYQEGSAVFMETWMMGGVGRAQGGYDEMVFRAMVRENARFYDPLGLVSKGTEIDFKTGANAYLYGTRFADYLAFTYGPDRLLDWWRRDQSSRRYYADDFQRVFGLPLAESWRRWIEFEHAFQQKNLVSVREQPITEYHDLTRKDLGAVSRTYLSADGTRLFAAIRYPGQLAHVVSIGRRDGRVTELTEVKGPIGYNVCSLAYDPGSETLFYTTSNNAHRNLEALDLRSGKSRMLLRAARIGDLVFNSSDRSLWGLRLNNGFVMLVRVPFPYTDWQTLYTFPRGQRAFDLDLSPDGSLVSVSVSGPNPKPGLPQVTEVRVLRAETLARGDATPVHTLTMGSAVPESFVFSKDGRYLYGSSYFTGVSNVYRYELASETLDAVSNADIGFFRPLPLDGSELIVLRYAAKGFVPTLIEAKPTEDLSAVTFLGEQVATKYPEVQGWVAAPPSSIPDQPKILRQGDYRPMRELKLDSVIPVVEGYKDSVGAGLAASFSDPLGYDAAGFDASYTPDNALPSKERLHFTADVHHTRWTAGVAWNRADFYDLFGPTKRSLAGYNGYVNYNLPLVFDPPEVTSFSASVAYYGDLDTLPGYQNVTSPSKNLFTADAGFAGSDTRGSPGAVDDEAGHSWSINSHLSGAAGELIPSVTATGDLGFPLPLNHSSIWLRTGAAISGGSPADPLANYYLGAFGNNYVDSGSYGIPQRYRGLLSMPGFDLQALHGKSLVKGMLEWCLPPVRFEALGSPGFYLTWARPELFAGALETNLGTSGTRTSAQDVGAQVDFQLHVMHRAPMMLSIGAARGFGGGSLGKSEFMLSLQVL
jgi:hypothetical protein